MAKIAVIHGEENIRLFYSEELKDVGYEVVAHASMLELMEFLEEEKPDLIILGEEIEDLDKSYLDLMFEIKRAFPSFKIILATCYGFGRDDWRTKFADASVVISSDTTELKRKIVEALET